MTKSRRGRRLDGRVDGFAWLRPVVADPDGNREQRRAAARLAKRRKRGRP